MKTSKGARRGYSRHGMTAPLVRVRLQGFRAVDRRTAGAREALAFRGELISALGGEADLSPQRRKLVDMAARAALILDHVDAWIVSQENLVNQRSRTLLPIVTQRTGIAEHLSKLLDRLGLDRAPQKVMDLNSYIASKYPIPETPHQGAVALPHHSPSEVAEVAPDAQGATEGRQ